MPPYAWRALAFFLVNQLSEARGLGQVNYIGGGEAGFMSYSVIVRTTDRPPRRPRADAVRSFSSIAARTLAAAGC